MGTKRVAYPAGRDRSKRMAVSSMEKVVETRARGVEIDRGGGRVAGGGGWQVNKACVRCMS